MDVYDFLRLKSEDSKMCLRLKTEHADDTEKKFGEGCSSFSQTKIEHPNDFPAFDIESFCSRYFILGVAEEKQCDPISCNQSVIVQF